MCRTLGEPTEPQPKSLARYVISMAASGHMMPQILQGVAAVSRWGAGRGAGELSASAPVSQALRLAAQLGALA